MANYEKQRELVKSTVKNNPEYKKCMRIMTILLSIGAIFIIIGCIFMNRQIIVELIALVIGGIFLTISMKYQTKMRKILDTAVKEEIAKEEAAAKAEAENVAEGEAVVAVSSAATEEVGQAIVEEQAPISSLEGTSEIKETVVAEENESISLAEIQKTMRVISEKPIEEEEKEEDTSILPTDDARALEVKRIKADRLVALDKHRKLLTGLALTAVLVAGILLLFLPIGSFLGLEFEEAKINLFDVLRNTLSFSEEKTEIFASFEESKGIGIFSFIVAEVIILVVWIKFMFGLLVSPSEFKIRECIISEGKDFMVENYLTMAGEIKRGDLIYAVFSLNGYAFIGLLWLPFKWIGFAKEWLVKPNYLTVGISIALMVLSFIFSIILVSNMSKNKKDYQEITDILYVLKKKEKQESEGEEGQ